MRERYGINAKRTISEENRRNVSKENLDFYKEINADQLDPTLKYLDSEEVGWAAHVYRLAFCNAGAQDRPCCPSSTVPFIGCPRCKN
ncbi:UNVERIFIED_CONTAM: hypothetical protein ABID98_001721 [Brevibacillus sp. OAP136]